VSVPVKELQALYAEAQNPDARLTLDTLERLAELLRQLGGERRGSPAGVARVPDARAVAVPLESLRMGPPPETLRDEPRQLWQALEDEWATPDTLRRLTEEAGRLLAPYRQGVSDSDRAEAELAESRERLEALRLVADLLDELLTVS
jgi:hypothetical protein